MSLAEIGGSRPCLGLVEIHDHDASPVLAEQPCRRPADPALGRRSGDDTDFIGE